MGEHWGVVPGTGLGNQHRRVLVPGRVGARVVASAGAARLGVAQQVAVALEQVDERLDQRHHPIRGRGARSQRRVAAQDALLEGALLVVDERHHQAGAVAEAVEDRALTNAGGAGDLVDGDVLDAAMLEEGPSGGEHLLAVAGRVGAARRRGAAHGKLGGGCARALPGHPASLTGPRSSFARLDSVSGPRSSQDVIA